MRILKTRSFAKDAESEGLSDNVLLKAIQEVQAGLIDEDQDSEVEQVNRKENPKIKKAAKGRGPKRRRGSEKS